MAPAPTLDHCLKLHKERNWQGAISAYHQLLGAQPKNLTALANLGAVYRQCNDVENAVKYYEKAIEINPEFIECWFNYGNLCTAIKDFDRARHCYQQILSLQPENSQALFQLAIVFRQLQQWEKSRDLLVNLLAITPDNTNALLELGNAWKHLGEPHQSLQCFLSLINAEPDSWKGHFSLAKWYDSANDPGLFEQHMTFALQHAPSAWLVHYNLGQARFDNGDYQGAFAQYQIALNEKKGDPETLIALGGCAMRLNNEKEARALFGQVSRTENVETLSKLATVIWEYKFFDEAIAVLKKIVSLQPHLADAHMNLAKAQYQAWLTSDALASIQTALELNPNNHEAQKLQPTLLLRQGKVDDYLKLHPAFSDQDAPSNEDISSYLFAELYSAQVSAQKKYSHHRQAMDRWVTELAIPHAFDNTKEPNRKLKIGLISGDFRDQHPVGLFVQPLLDYLDKTKFSIVGYYCSQTYDSSTELIKSKMDDWFDVASWADRRLRSKILTDNIDILIDLSGHTSKNKLRVFAMRAAPIQVTWMAYPHSSGLSSMDYIVADHIVCPAENDALCSEAVARLTKHSVFCFPPTEEFGGVDLDKANMRNSTVFGSFNNLTKVNNETLTLWRDVVLCVPDSKLKLKTPSFADPQCRQDYLDYFMQAGIAEDRLIFSGPSSLESMMREYNDVDIALDTFPYNGGTTTFQALWMGVPVLTINGDNFCGRMGASAMTHLDMQDWIADSREEFVALAVSHASNRKELLKIKADLRERMTQSALCDEAGFGQEFGQLLNAMWIDYCRKA